MAKILVVDDNQQLNSMLKDVLEAWGYQVILATEGLQALEIAKQQRPSVILLDVMLPGLSGYEVCSTLRADSDTRQVGIIMMSALADIDSRIHGFTVQADNFLVKPINYDELKAIINRLLVQKKQSCTTEGRPAVIATISNILKLFCKDEVEDFTETKLYCDKLAVALGFSSENAAKVQIALEAYKTSALCNRLHIQLPQLLKAIEPLNLSTWITPVLSYLNAPPNKIGGTAPVLEDQQLKRVADLVQLVDSFIQAARQVQGNKELALAMLDRESRIRYYDRNMLEQLKQIIKDEKVLESIS